MPNQNSTENSAPETTTVTSNVTGQAPESHAVDSAVRTSEADSMESVVDQNGDVILSAEDCCTIEDMEEAVAGFLVGDLTLAQLEGITAEEMYSIADTGYDLLEAGKLDPAKKIFEGLACYNPMDPYFHSVLGSIYQREHNYEQAVAEYRGAAELYPEDVSTWTNLGETLMVWAGELQTAGESDKAVEAFEGSVIALQEAVKRTPKNAPEDSGLRAQALIAVASSICQDGAVA